METEFGKALVSKERNAALPEEVDWFAPMLGSWDTIWTTGCGTSGEVTQKGEWIFSRVLNGFGIEDLFIVPSREERIRLNMPNAEYGATIRMYQPDTQCWQIYYTCLGEYTRLEARKEADSIVLTEISGKRMKWFLSDITPDSFHWQNIMMNEEGNWQLMCDCRAIRRAEK